MKELKEAVVKEIKEHGLKMSKKLQSGSYGFFFSSDDVYDNRTVYSYEEACKLAGQGFTITFEQNSVIGLMLFNVIMKN